MITHLRGQLIHKASTRAVVDVGGVGYGVAISLATCEALPVPEAPVRLFTYLYVREDRLELFGFAEALEREAFELLIGVSGIGPPSALSILSGMSVGDLQRAVLHERVDELRAIKGIGRKTAERMIVELRDKMTLELAAPAAGEAGAAAGVVEEAVLALKALGITPSAARRAVGRVVKNNGSELSVQQLIKRALQER